MAEQLDRLKNTLQAVYQERDMWKLKFDTTLQQKLSFQEQLDDSQR